MSSYVLTEPLARIIAIMQGLGKDGALGAAAQASALDVDEFRFEKAPLIDPGIDASKFHRAFHVEWISGRDDPSPPNEFNPTARNLMTFELQVGYYEGTEVANLAHRVSASDSQLYVVENVSAVALSDAERIRDALCFPTLFQGTPTTPVILDVRRIGDSVPRRLGDSGRVVCTSRFVLHISRTRRVRIKP